MFSSGTSSCMLAFWLDIPCVYVGDFDFCIMDSTSGVGQESRRVSYNASTQV